MTKTHPLKVVQAQLRAAVKRDAKIKRMEAKWEQKAQQKKTMAQELLEAVQEEEKREERERRAPTRQQPMQRARQEEKLAPPAPTKTSCEQKRVPRVAVAARAPPAPVEDKRLERHLCHAASPERREETPVGVRRTAPCAARATRVVPDVEEREEPRRQRCAEVEASVSAYPSCQPGRYPCKQCTKIYSYKVDLTRHEKDHENVVYSCEKCGKYSTKSEKNLVEHMRHCGVGGLYVCDTCGEKFDSRKARWRHEQRHKKK